jgi:hypothetical protein
MTLKELEDVMDWRENQGVERQLITLADSMEIIISAAEGVASCMRKLRTQLRELAIPSSPTDPGDPIRRAIQEKAAAGETR